MQRLALLSSHLNHRVPTTPTEAKPVVLADPTKWQHFPLKEVQRISPNTAM